jgi:hypothetical protein
MENKTKQMRKARRQGVARKKDLSAPSRRQQVRGQQTPRDDTGTDPAANTRRRTTLTQRKTERQARSNARRAMGRRTSKK